MSTIHILNKDYIVKSHWFWKNYSPDTWEPQTLEVFKKYINENTTYIDLGAWLGVTIMYAHVLGCKKIYGVEANPASFELLKENCSMNGINAQLSNICLCNKNEPVSFGVDTGHLATSSASSIRGEGYTVQGVKLLDYLKDIPSDNLFIKIDIEGAEELIIDDLVEFLKSHKAVVYLSIHVPFLQDKTLFYNKLKQLKVFDENLEEHIMSNEVAPSWGTKQGNFFEVVIN